MIFFSTFKITIHIMNERAIDNNRGCKKVFPLMLLKRLRMVRRTAIIIICRSIIDVNHQI